MDDRDACEDGSGKIDDFSRDPSLEDLVELCRGLNLCGAKYIVAGGFAVRFAGLRRSSICVNLVIDTSLENETRVFKVLESLPDGAVRELDPGDVAKYNVVRVCDEIVVDLMRSACGIDYAEAIKDVVIHEVDGVSIPFASPRLLWRMKAPTHRAKDAGDLAFLRQYFAERGEEPPKC
jgi:hypothetical protein